MSGQSTEKAQLLRRVAIAMREQHGPEHERHEMWSAMETLLFMVADHTDGRGNTCGSCVDQAVAVAEAYEHVSPPDERRRGMAPTVGVEDRPGPGRDALLTAEEARDA